MDEIGVVATHDEPLREAKAAWEPGPWVREPDRVEWLVAGGWAALLGPTP